MDNNPQGNNKKVEGFEESGDIKFIVVESYYFFLKVTVFKPILRQCELKLQVN